MSSDTQLQTIESLKQDLTQRDLEIRALRLANEKMKVELTHLRRMRYGRSSEKMDAAQSQLELLSAALAPVVPVIAPHQAGLQVLQDGIAGPLLIKSAHSTFNGIFA
jgi:transposase